MKRLFVKRLKLQSMKAISMMMSVILMLSIFTSAVTVTAASDNPESYTAAAEKQVFDFHKLGVDNHPSLPKQDTQQGWSIDSAVTTAVYSQNLYGLHVENDDPQGRIGFRFEMAAAGMYEVRFSSFLAGGGGVSDIRVDGKSIGSYNFYGSGNYSDVVTLTKLWLDEGEHTLVFQATGQTQGWGHRMYPTEIIFEPTTGDPQEQLVLSYDFHKLGVYDPSVNWPKQDTQEGWSIDYDLSTITKWSQNSYGLHVENDSRTIGGDSKPAGISFSFHVPESSPYDLALTGFVAGGGSIVDVYVDDKWAGQYDFYGNGTAGPAAQLRSLQLEEGIHKLVMQVAGRSPGSWGYRMYPSMFTVTKIGQLPVLEKVEVTAARSSLIVGQSTGLSVKGVLSNGRSDSLHGSLVTYSSDNEAVATVDPESGQVIAHQEGTAIVEAHVSTAEGMSMKGSVTILVEKYGLREVWLNSEELQLLAGNTRRISVRGIMNDGSTADLSAPSVTRAFISNDPAVAQVDDNGMITAQALGETEIRAEVTLDGIKRQSSLKVKVVPPVEEKAVKTRSTYYTSEKVQAARQNIEKYDWAKSARDAAVERAKQYLDFGAEKLWEIVTPQSLPRAFMVNEALGSPVTGRDVYNYGEFPWKADPLKEPWKLTDPSSGKKFPTNDFEAYYKSGLDEYGLFDPTLAKRELLVNTSYPDQGEKWGIDDGFGYVDTQGNKFMFIPYYIHWYIWHHTTGVIPNALSALGDAYLYTGDLKYAKAGIALLDRVADVYPSMDLSPYRDADGFLNSHGGTGKGKTMGSIQETFLARQLAKSYDIFYPALADEDAAGVVPFLSQKASALGLLNPKNSTTFIRKNIEDGILRQIYPATQNAQIHGNSGMHQSALTMAAVVLDDPAATREWLDWVFRSGGLVADPEYRLTGGNILNLLVKEVDRDGFGNEGAPGYNAYWIDLIKVVADILAGYDRYPEADLYQNPKFRKMFYSGLYQLMSGTYTPNIGDSGQTGNPGIQANLENVIDGFVRLQDPLLARFAYYLNGNKLYGIHGDLFSADPEAVTREIEEAIRQYGPLDSFESMDLSGFGLGTLRDGSNYIRNYGLVYDFLGLPISDSSGKEPKPFTNSGTLQYEALQSGEYIAFSFDVPRTDTYDILLKAFKASSYGIYDITIDGQPVTTFDFYGPNGAKTPVKIGERQLTQGRHEIRFVGVGKNAGSDNYKMGIIQLSLLDEQAKEEKRLVDEKGNTLRDAWIYYGRNINHGHYDTLNLGLHAYGLDLSPDLGYPENTGEWPSRMEWTRNTISHNTVVVDKSRQKDQWVGTPRHFGDGRLAKVMDIEAPQAYPQTDLYKRTTTMIRVDDANSYLVDFFRVEGGSDHHFSFHGPEGSVTTEGLELVAQGGGTYAGSDVKYTERPAGDSTPGWGYQGSGFHYLYNVERDEAPQTPFSIDWKAADTWKVLKEDTDVHLRLTMLNDIDDLALADGQPPQNRPGNPKNLKYVIAHRSGSDLSSTFTSVIEPYQKERYIKSISAPTVKYNGQKVVDESVKAVKVELMNGRTDYIVSAIDNEAKYIIDDRIEFQGFFGIYSEIDGESAYAYVNDGAAIGLAGEPVISNRIAAVQGNIVDFEKTLTRTNWITINASLNEMSSDSLVGKTIYVDNDGIRNAAYRIQGVETLDGGKYKLHIGDSTLIRGFADTDDFSKGYVYDVAPGATYRIPMDYEERAVQSLTVKGITVPLQVGEQARLSVSALYWDGESEDVTSSARFSVDRESVVNIARNGEVKAIAPGHATIKAEFGGKSAEWKVEVSQIAVNPISSDGVSVVAEPETGTMVVTQQQLRPGPDGRTVLELPKQVHTVVFPFEAWPEQTSELELVKGSSSILVPGESVRQLLSKLPPGFGKGARLEWKVSDVSLEEVEGTLGRASGKGVTLSASGTVLELGLSVVSSDNKRMEIQELEGPILLRLQTGGKADQRLLGIYRLHTGEKVEYIGGKTDAADMEAEIRQLGKYGILAYEASYADIEAGHWAEEALRVLSAKHIVTGTGGGLFEPQREVTRAEFIAMLVRLLGLPTTGTTLPFKDVVSDDWFAGAVASSEAAGLVEGDDERLFAPLRPISREEMAVMLLRAYQWKTGQEYIRGHEGAFADQNEASEWARESIHSAAELGLLVGRGDGRFVPKDTASRAESAQAIYRLLTT